MTKQQILGDVEMVSNPDVDGGQVSREALPLDDARRLARELTDAGFEADWARDNDGESYAWLYVAPEPMRDGLVATSGYECAFSRHR